MKHVCRKCKYIYEDGLVKGYVKVNYFSSSLALVSNSVLFCVREISSLILLCIGYPATAWDFYGQAVSAIAEDITIRL